MIDVYETMSANSDNKILDMIISAIKDEIEDIEYYGELTRLAADPEDKDIIRQIRMDEQKHFCALDALYESLTGKKAVIDKEKKVVGADLKEEYKNSIFSELAGVEFYRKLYFAFADSEIRDLVLDILMDEQAHAVKMTFLHGKTV